MLSEVQPFFEKGQVDSIRCSTRPDCIDRESCSLLQDFGVSTVELGVQSMNDKVLRFSRRGHTAARSRQALNLLKEMGFITGVQLMPGLPGESCLGFLRGVRDILRLQPDLLRLYPALVIRESVMADLYNGGNYQPLSLSAAVCLCAAASKLAKKANVTVIRMGLQPSPSLEESIVAGPYHPSFGELVRSRIWLQRFLHSLQGVEKEKKIMITVSHRDISAAIGVNKENRKRLDALGFAGRYAITADPAVKKGSFYAVCQ